MRKFWVGAAVIVAGVGLVAGDIQASTSNVKSNITVISTNPVPKKKVAVIKVEQKKAQPKREYRVAAVQRTCGSFFECLFRTRPRTTNASFSSTSGMSDRTTRSTVSFGDAKYTPGSIVVRTPERALYYVLPGGKALRYKVGVGRDGFQWSGNSTIGMKREWPDWRPPAVMIAREAAKGNKIPDYMEGGPNNPLGARAMYINGTMFRIHGTNNSASIGGAVSSGCIRMMNADVIDLYDRVDVGSRVYVYQ
jgi:lipoprotein-anchoring transpeptidase ErfK/SrfK